MSIVALIHAVFHVEQLSPNSSCQLFKGQCHDDLVSFKKAKKKKNALVLTELSRKISLRNRRYCGAELFPSPRMRMSRALKPAWAHLQSISVSCHRRTSMISNVKISPYFFQVLTFRFQNGLKQTMICSSS